MKQEHIKSPLGLMKRKFWIEIRISDLTDAISRHLAERIINADVNQWADELVALISEYRTQKKINVEVHKRDAEDWG